MQQNRLSLKMGKTLLITPQRSNSFFSGRSFARGRERRMGEEPPQKRPTRSEGYRSLFMSVFPELVSELTDEGLENPEISVGIQHLKEVCVGTIVTHKCTIIIMNMYICTQ